MGRYSDEEIKRIDAVLLYLKDHGSYSLNRMPGVQPPAEMNRSFIEKTVVGSGLGIVDIDKYVCFLTDEGRKAADMGFAAWLEERERKAQEPLPVKEVKSESEKRLAKWLAWSGIIGGVAAGIDILLRLLGLF